MRWVFCLNEAGSKTENLFYLKYAVLSAKKYTKLDPVCLFLGTNTYLEKFLKNNNIPVIKVVESPVSSQLKYFHSSSPFWNLKTHEIIDFASGSFLRFEIHKYIPDKYCLYTDVDVLFTPNFKIPKVKPKYFAASYQDINNSEMFNSGVMVLNLHNFSKDLYGEFINEGLNSWEEWTKAWYDQYLFNHLYKEKIDLLDISYNWRPLFGDDSKKQIIHFEKFKPFKNNSFLLKYKNSIDLYENFRDSYFSLMADLELGD
jgi:lipopolysaccharide biosynthesis glycosyltransferase